MHRNCFLLARDETTLSVVHRTLKMFTNSQSDPIWSKIDPLRAQIDPLWSQTRGTLARLQKQNTNKMSYSLHRASDISRKKKQTFAGFSGANSRKNRPISRDFRGKKSQNSQKNRPISRDFSGQSQISKDFYGQILRKIGRFQRKFRGETSPRNQRRSE